MYRDAVVAYALSIVGLTSPDERYLALVAEWEVQHADRFDALDIAKHSDCALVAWAILEGAGVPMPPRGKYIPGHAVTNLIDAAKAAGAYVPRPLVICPGDVVHFAAARAPEHVGTVVADDERVDGGQRDEKGNETIKHVTRKLLRLSTGYFMETDTNRLVAAVIDPDKF